MASSPESITTIGVYGFRARAKEARPGMTTLEYAMAFSQHHFFVLPESLTASKVANSTL
jgi:hypothetical protein